MVSAGSTYISGSTADDSFSPTLANWELNISAISLGVSIISSPTLMLDMVLWLEALEALAEFWIFLISLQAIGKIFTFYF